MIKLDFFIKKNNDPITMQIKHPQNVQGFWSKKKPSSRCKIVKFYTLFKKQKSKTHTLFSGIFHLRSNQGVPPRSHHDNQSLERKRKIIIFIKVKKKYPKHPNKVSSKQKKKKAKQSLNFCISTFYSLDQFIQK